MKALPVAQNTLPSTIPTPALGEWAAAVFDFELPSWRDGALCRRRPDVNFYPPGAAGVIDAKRVCAECPSRLPCGAWALSHHEAEGIWGGMSERQRERIWRRQRATRQGAA